MSNCESFKFSLHYDRDVLRQEVIHIEIYRQSLKNMFLPKDWQEDLRRLYIVRAVHGTTAIEGNPLSEEEVARQVGKGNKWQAKNQVEQQTKNAEKAFEWVEIQFIERRPIRLKDICAVHKILTTGSDHHNNNPGRIRLSGHNVTVGSPQLGGVHRAASGGEILKRLLEEFLAFIHSSEFLEQHAVIQSLVTHFYFVTLHPFGDGNGRTTRCIEAAILYGAGYNTYGFYSLSNFFYRNRDEYFRILQDTRTKYKYDITKFLLFGLRGFRDELDQINNYIRNRTHRLKYRDLIRRCLEKRISPRRKLLNERESNVLHRILDKTKIPDPFSGESSMEITWDELMDICWPLYSNRATRTTIREIYRLEELGFVKFSDGMINENWRIAVDFSAIERY